jgi:hypothetical protein
MLHDLLKERAEGFKLKMQERQRFEEAKEIDIRIKDDKPVTTSGQVIKNDYQEKEERKSGKYSICDICEDPSRRFDLKKYILKQSGGKIFYNLQNGTLVIPSCACDYAEPI